MAKKKPAINTVATPLELPPSFVVLGTNHDDAGDIILAVCKSEQIASDTLSKIVPQSVPSTTTPDTYDEYRIEEWCGRLKKLIEVVRLKVCDPEYSNTFINPPKGREKDVVYVAAAQCEGGKNILAATPHLMEAIQAVDDIISTTRESRVEAAMWYEVVQYFGTESLTYQTWNIRWEKVPIER